MDEQQYSRYSTMSFTELLCQDEKIFQVNNTWVPITPEKPILLRSNPVSDWPDNQMGRANYQTFPIPGSDHMKEKLLHYYGPDQNHHLIGQTDQTGENKNFDCNLTDRNSVLNHIAGSYTQPWHYDNGSNSNPLELLFKKNATNMTSVNRNSDASINMAAGNSLLPKFYPQASSDSQTNWRASYLRHLMVISFLLQLIQREILVVTMPS
ncbi:hypothetical protein VNO77_13036 [Canavalia gladiata]|uniref:Uncharacterized protein n=1 Tax=Canavalia gladiata TaxID=3824 RepID=A0AAN9M0K9_CANGL